VYVEDVKVEQLGAQNAVQLDESYEPARYVVVEIQPFDAQGELTTPRTTNR